MSLGAGEGARLTRKQWALVVGYGIAIYGLAIAGRELTGRDEPRVAGIARAMAISGDLAVPRLNGAPFLEYPPLGYYGTAAALRIADGASDVAAHLPGALLAVATACVTAALGAALAGASAGCAAGLLLETMPGFWGPHRSVLVDTSLVFWVTLSIAGFMLAWIGAPRARAWAACFWLGIAGGFLSKGLIGAGLPIVVAIGFAAAAFDRAALRRVGIAWGWALAAAPVGAWIALVARSGGRETVEEVMRQSVLRFVSGTADHAGPWHFYAGPVAYKTAPLVLIAAWALAIRFGSKRGSEANAIWPAAKLPAIWLGLTLAVLSAASAKRDLYLLPLDPAAALLAAMLWVRVRAHARFARAVEVGWLAAFAIFVVAAWRGDFLQEDRAASLRPAFELVARERGGRALLLDRPTEGLEGATVFYLGETAPRVTSRAALDAALADRSPRIVVSERAVADADPPGVRVLGTFPFGSRSLVVVSAAPPPP